jgi:hypothetical protein
MKQNENDQIAPCISIQNGSPRVAGRNDDIDRAPIQHRRERGRATIHNEKRNVPIVREGCRAWSTVECLCELPSAMFPIPNSRDIARASRFRAWFWLPRDSMMSKSNKTITKSNQASRKRKQTRTICVKQEEGIITQPTMTTTTSPFSTYDNTNNDGMLMQAQAVSFRRTSNDTDNRSSNSAAKTPTLITIPSSNVLLERSPALSSSSTALVPSSNPSSYYSEYYTTTTSAPERSSSLVSTTAVVAYNGTAAADGEESLSQLRPRQFRGRIVKAKNLHLPDSILAFKQARQTRTALATYTGGAIGLVVLGPVGGLICAYAAYGVAKSVGKAKERRLIRQAGVLSLPMDGGAEQHPPAVAVATPVVFVALPPTATFA